MSEDTTRLRYEGPPAERPLAQALWRGFCLRCPNCNKGRLFKGFLKSVDHCAVCGQEYHHHRADDLPPYLTIFIVGHVVIAAFMGVQHVGDLPLWGHLAIWIPITTLLTLGLLMPLKGATIALQWAIRMHGFDERAQDEAS